jgi:hypothetical protein
MKTMKLCLTIEVEYAPNGTTLQGLKDMMHAVADRAAGEGMLTGETPAVVEGWKASVEEVKDEETITNPPATLISR